MASIDEKSRRHSLWKDGPMSETRQATLRQLVPGLAAFAVSLVLVAVQLVPSGSAEATSTQVGIRPGLTGSTLYNYGWHHNDNGYGALDFSGPASGSDVSLRAQLLQTQADLTRWVFTRIGSCKIEAQPEAEYLPGAWAIWPQRQVQYLHIDNRIASNSVSSAVKNSGATVTKKVGEHGDCGTGDVHLHQSGATTSGYGLVTWAYGGADSCWGSASVCPGSNWKEDNGQPTASTCDGSEDWSGNYATVSGNNSKYACETWSIRTNSPSSSAYVFYLWW